MTLCASNALANLAPWPSSAPLRARMDRQIPLLTDSAVMQEAHSLQAGAVHFARLIVASARGPCWQKRHLAALMSARQYPTAIMVIRLGAVFRPGIFKS